MTHSTYEFALPLPITQMELETAQAFAQQQPTSSKAEQVRLNTLAVLVVRDYLQLMEIATDLDAGDSWNPVMRLCADVADLELAGKGRLECRVVKPQQSVCLVPPETWEDRVGYVVVEVNESEQEAQLLGFVPEVGAEELPLSELRSPEELLDYLAELQPETKPVLKIGREIADSVTASITNLGQWLQGTVEAGWQTVESVLNPAQLSPAYAFRSRRTAVRQARRIDLGNQVPTLALVVEVNPAEANQMDVVIQLHPTNGQPNLPAGLSLAVIDENGQTVLDAVATGNEDFLELQFAGHPGEPFSLTIALNENCVTQEFVI